jgi:hypothetical protein
LGITTLQGPYDGARVGATWTAEELRKFLGKTKNSEKAKEFLELPRDK